MANGNLPVNENYMYRDIHTISSPNKFQYKDSFDEDAIFNALLNLFTTRLGSVPGKPWLGNNLPDNLFENVSEFQEIIISKSVQNTIDKFEPRVQAVEVLVDIKPEKNSIFVEVYYYMLFDPDKLKKFRASLNFNNMSFISIRKET
jgi:phage baseplate assembly protein W